MTLNLFRKSAGCPASQMLLAYRRARVTLIEKICVEAHLAHCEFCSAELQLLERYRYPSDLEESIPTEIPAGLRQLAENLLRSKGIGNNPPTALAEPSRASH